MLPLMSPQDVKRKLEAGEIRLVDIREPDEVASLRIEGAEIAPLSVIRWQDFRPVTDKPVVFTCNSGRRTKNNSDLLEQLAAGEAWQMEGGATAWDKAGLPVVRSRRSLPMFRQIQIGAGGMVLLGLALGQCGASGRARAWRLILLGALSVAAGLCGLRLLLARMPWNKK